MPIKKYTINKKFSYWGLVITLVAFHIVIGLKTVSFGTTLSELEAEEAKINAEIKDLSSNLVETSSLTKINENSEKLGFKKPDSTVFVSEREFVAGLPF